MKIRCSFLLVFAVSFWFLGATLTCQLVESPVLSSRDSWCIHPDASISSRSGAGHWDQPCDWAPAVAQQGGVKPAGMFHIHTQRGYIISPSSDSVLSGGSLFYIFMWSWLFFFSCFVAEPDKLCSRPSLRGVVVWYSWQMLDLVRAGNLGLQVFRADDDLWLTATCLQSSPVPTKSCTLNRLWGWNLLRRRLLSLRYQHPLIAMIKQTKNKNVSWVSEVCWWNESFLLYSWTSCFCLCDL